MKKKDRFLFINLIIIVVLIFTLVAFFYVIASGFPLVYFPGIRAVLYQLLGWVLIPLIMLGDPVLIVVLIILFIRRIKQHKVSKISQIIWFICFMFIHVTVWIFASNLYIHST